MTQQPVDLIWWITAVEIPAVAGLFWLNWRVRQEMGNRIEALRSHAACELTACREGLSAFKLDVARNYVSIPYLKDIEKRLTAHLLRIEAKLDFTPKQEGKDG
jgi:hypothetical protein